jgi:hypothetical protein
MAVTKYKVKIVAASNEQELEDQLTDFLSLGWELQTLFPAPGGDGTKYLAIFCQ